MSAFHPPQEDFALYVMGALERQDCERLEQHVRTCAACAELLASEARVEVKLHAIIANIPRPDEKDTSHRLDVPPPGVLEPVVFSSSRRTLWAPALVLLAASVALVFGLGRVITPPSGHLSDALPYTPQEFSIPLFSEEASLPASPLEPQTMMCARQVKHEQCALSDGDEASACDEHSDEMSDGDPQFTPVSATCVAPR